jgi:MFS family permease
MTQSPATPRYTWYVVFVCFLVYTVNFVDRMVLNILLPAIKADLQLSDTQLGLLSGTVFGLFYATLGIPIGRLADRHSRRNIIAICIAVWSAMTALCGTAHGFVQLLIFRTGVGVGEAGGSPPAISLISDYVPPARRATALALFSMGVPTGFAIGYLSGGYLLQYFDWRQAFYIVGLPGLLVAALVWLTVREPQRDPEREIPAIRVVFTHLWQRRSFRHLSFASGLYAFAGYSAGSWMPSFLDRSHGLTPVQQGQASALIIALGAGLGTFFGGVIADRWAKRDRRAYALLPAITMALAVPFAYAYLVENTALAITLALMPALLGQMYQAPAFAATQSLGTPTMRVSTAAILFFMINIIGLACGPVFTGYLSDTLQPRFGDDSLGYALAAVTVGSYAWASIHFWLASRDIVEDFDYVERIS